MEQSIQFFTKSLPEIGQEGPTQSLVDILQEIKEELSERQQDIDELMKGLQRVHRAMPRRVGSMHVSCLFMPYRIISMSLIMMRTSSGIC